MSGAYVKKFDACPRMDLEAAETSLAFQTLKQRVPEQAARLTRLLQNPAMRAHRIVGPAETMGRFAVHYVRIAEGSDFPEHAHDDAVAAIYVIEGRGRAVLDGNSHPVEAGDTIYVPPGAFHEIIAEGGSLTYLACVSPDFGQGQKADFRFTGEGPPPAAAAKT
jgi:quercetin dioxygenase-like cupin family protein